MKGRRRKATLAARMATLSEIARNSGLAWRLLWDPRVPKMLKLLIPGAIAAYIILPVDLIPDFVPVLGQVDDLTTVLMGITALVRLSPKEAVTEHREAMSGKMLWRLVHTQFLRKGGQLQQDAGRTGVACVQRQPSMSVAVRNLARHRR